MRKSKKKKKKKEEKKKKKKKKGGRGKKEEKEGERVRAGMSQNRSGLRGPFPLSMRGESDHQSHIRVWYFIANIVEDIYAFWTILLSILDNVISHVPHTLYWVLYLSLCVCVCVSQWL